MVFNMNLRSVRKWKAGHLSTIRQYLISFSVIFQMLPDRFPDRTTMASETRENMYKNRYPDIKAYDQTRVKLSQIDSIVGSDYINANFVVGYKERKKFICAQGEFSANQCNLYS